MRAFWASLLALAAFAVGLLVATVTSMAQDEIRRRLGNLPMFLIRLAALRPSLDVRERLGDEWDEQVDEWRRQITSLH